MRRLMNWLRKVLDDGEAYQLLPGEYPMGRYVCGEFVPTNELYDYGDEEKLLEELRGRSPPLKVPTSRPVRSVPTISYSLRKKLRWVVGYVFFWRRRSLKLDIADLLQRHSDQIAAVNAALVQTLTPQVPTPQVPDPNMEGLLEVEAAVMREMSTILGKPIVLGPSRCEHLRQWARGEGGNIGPKKIAAVLLVKWGEVGGKGSQE